MISFRWKRRRTVPSQVISDQFRSVTVVTEDGLVHSGMPLPEARFRTLVLLLPDSTRLEVPRSEVAEQHPAAVSVMPEGLLNPLSDQEIVDLFAYLETSKSNETAAR